MESLLLKAPAVVRTVAANLVSWRLNRSRRARTPAYVAGRDLIRRYHEEPWELLQEEQTGKLARTLEQACAGVKLYAGRCVGGTQADARAMLADMAPVTKDEVRGAGDRALQPGLSRRRHHVARTSGSTGTPFAFRLTLEALQMRFGLRDGFYALHGFDFRELNLRLGGRLFLSTGKRRPPYWIRDYGANQLLFSVYHISDANMPAFVEALEKYRPRWITGYPSAVYLLARGCRTLGSSYRPLGVFTDSETVLDPHREEVRNAWGCAIHDYYGMEVGWVAGQCKLGKYHLSPLTSVVELLDEEGRPVGPGQLGELVVTDLTNPLMPLIRYRTGDMAVWSERPCPCGWNTPTLERIEGRRDDIVTLPDGRKIGRLDHILKPARGIREAQLVQYTPREFVLYVVPEDGYDDSVARLIRNEASLRLGKGVSFRIETVPEIEKTRTGKLRSVVSHVGGTGGRR